MTDLGWYKSYRSIFDSNDYLSLQPESRIIIFHLLGRSNYKKSEVIIEGKELIINPGQWLTSIPTIEKFTFLTPRQIRTALDSLKKTGFLDWIVTPGNHRIITIKNWSIYQSDSRQTNDRRSVKQTTDDLTEEATDDFPYDSDNKTTDGLTDDSASIRQTTGLKTTESKELRSKEVKKKDLKDIVLYQNIFDYWNTKTNVIKHRAFVNPLKDKLIRLINSRIKEEFTEQDICDAINNYDKVLGGPEFFFNYKWNLELFLKQSNAFPNFVNDADPLNNYLADKTKKINNGITTVAQTNNPNTLPPEDDWLTNEDKYQPVRDAKFYLRQVCTHKEFKSLSAEHQKALMDEAQQHADNRSRIRH